MASRELNEFAAMVRHVNGVLGESDLSLIDRRIREWATGVQAAAYDPDRTSPANVVDDDGIPVPARSDPTANAALRVVDVPDYRQILRRAVLAVRDLERVLPELTRSPDPTLFDLRATDTADKVRPGAGECEACGHVCSGLRKDRIKRGVCSTCYARVLRGEQNGRTREQTIAQIRSDPALKLDRVIVKDEGDAA